MCSIRDVLSRDGASLKAALALTADEARIEVQMLLQHVLKVSRAYLLAHPEQVLDITQVAAYGELLQRRLQGEPIAHILGEREFFGLNFKVASATLIPRPDTELLVELALRRIPQCEAARILDLGTGSGAIALSIAHARPDAEVTAVDVSQDALEVAWENVQRLNTGNVRLLCSDWFSALVSERFDLIVANPPYIAAGDAHLMQGDLRFEPLTALASGADGLDDIRRIISEAPKYLTANGWLLLEHGYDQAGVVRTLLQENGFDAVFSEKDIAGIERVSGGQIRL
ncbi:MAG: peptide chain release factor N(5)-glutamine methyltransferase [Sideroxyarcus sp.]|nr:peptide chain release factor N(5)-glutamine methyltransferase [Sideroxyarcus sp.]